MKLVFFAVDAVFVMFSAYIILYLYRLLYFKQQQLKKNILFIILFGSLNSLIHTISLHNNILNSFRPIMMLIISVFLMLVFIDKNVINALIIFIIETLALSIVNLIATLLLRTLGYEISIANLDKNIPLYAAVNIVTNIFLFLLVKLLSPIKHIFSSFKNRKSAQVIIFFTLLMIITLVSINFILNFNAIYLTISLLVLVIYCASLILVTKYSYQLELWKLERDQQNFYNQTLENYLQNQKQFKHDWNNNATVLLAYLKANKVDDAINYLQEMIDICDEAGPSNIFDIKNIALFGIITSKYNLARKKGITVDIKVLNTIEEIKNIKISDLSRIIGIFLDNAIEALEHEADKILKIKLSRDDKFINILIGNTCSSAPDLDKICESGYSTKGPGRGEGLNIVKNLIEKNKYVLNNTYYNEDEKMFYQELIIKVYH